MNYDATRLRRYRIIQYVVINDDDNDIAGTFLVHCKRIYFVSFGFESVRALCLINLKNADK